MHLSPRLQQPIPAPAVGQARAGLEVVNPFEISSWARRLDLNKRPGSSRDLFAATPTPLYATVRYRTAGGLRIRRQASVAREHLRDYLHHRLPGAGAMNRSQRRTSVAAG